MDEEKYQKLYNYALRLLSFRPRSIKEIKSKLSRFSIKRDFPSGLVEKLIANLTSQNLINDEEFAEWWTEQRQAFKPKGLRAIRLELQQKGIDKETIEKVLDEGKDNPTEFELALKVAEKKASYYRGLYPQEFRIKIGNLLLRRGFAWGTINKVIDYLGKKS